MSAESCGKTMRIWPSTGAAGGTAAGCVLVLPPLLAEGARGAAGAGGAGGATSAVVAPALVSEAAGGAAAPEAAGAGGATAAVVALVSGAGGGTVPLLEAPTAVPLVPVPAPSGGGGGGGGAMATGAPPLEASLDDEGELSLDEAPEEAWLSAGGAVRPALGASAALVSVPTQG